MRRWLARLERPVHWVGSSKRDLLSFPEPVIDNFGHALGVLQAGRLPPAAKPWKGEGAGVLELVESSHGNTWRVVVTVRFERAVYVLHCFQKKSPRGRATAREDIDLVRLRLRAAAEDYEVRHGKED